MTDDEAVRNFLLYGTPPLEKRTYYLSETVHVGRPTLDAGTAGV